MKKMPESLKAKIQMFKKSRLDISDLIEGYSLRDEDLSYSIISKFNRNDEDMTNINLAYSVIGTEGSKNPIIWTKCIVRNGIFKGTKFPGLFYFRKNDASGSNFNESYLAYMEYQGTNFTNCTFCDAVIRIGSRLGVGAKFDKYFFKELTKYWNLAVDVKNENKE